MKKHVVRILLFVLALCTMASLTSCVRFKVGAVSFDRGTFYSTQLYEFKYGKDSAQGEGVIGYIYSNDKMDVGFTFTLSNGKTNVTVTDVVEHYNILVIEGINTFFVTYYEFDDAATIGRTFASLEAAEDHSPVKRTVEVDKEAIIIGYYTKQEPETTTAEGGETA